MRRRDAVPYGGAVALLLALAVLAARLALAPIHAAPSAEACARAYATARTHADTVSTDLRSFADSAAHRRRRCGDLRIATVDLTRP